MGSPVFYHALMFKLTLQAVFAHPVELVDLEIPFLSAEQAFFVSFHIAGNGIEPFFSSSPDYMRLATTQ